MTAVLPATVEEQAPSVHLGARLAASVTDHLIAGVLVVLPLTWGFDGDTGLIATLLLALGLIYLGVAALSAAYRGITPGKWVFGLRTMSLGPLHAFDIVKRVSLLETLNVVLLLGMWSVMFDSSRQGWHYKLTGSSVERVPGKSVVDWIARVRANKTKHKAPARREQYMLPEPALDAPAEDFTRARTSPAVRRGVPVPIAPLPVPPQPVLPQPVLPLPVRQLPVPRLPQPLSQPTPPPPPPPPMSPPEPVAVEFPDIDQHTRFVPVPPAPQPVLRDQFWFSFDDGSRVEAAGSGLIGRDPLAQPDETAEHLIALDDPTFSVSKTHLEYRITDSAVWVRDRASTNGTSIEFAGTREQLTAWKGTRVPDGATVHIGARQFRVTRTQAVIS